MRWFGTLIALINKILLIIEVSRQEKKQQELQNERTKVEDDPVKYANDRFMRKPAGGDLPSDSTELDDRRDEP
jgi:hypothetical protein